MQGSHCFKRGYYTGIRPLTDTFDLDFQRQEKINQIHNLIWGAGNRTIADDYDSRFPREISPPNLVFSNWSAFFQDTMSFPDQKLEVLLGSKFELNHFTGFQYQPSLRATWKPKARHMFWAAISRAVRTPSRIGDGGFIRLRAAESSSGTTVVSTLFGNRGFEAEELLAFEMGYRVMPTDRLTLDVAAFANQYEGLRDIFIGPTFVEPFPEPAHLVVPVNTDNIIDAQIHGLEAAAKWQVLDFWRVNAAFTFLHVNSFPNTGNFEENDPKFQFNFRSHLDLPRNLELDGALYFVDELSNQDIPGYSRLDLRLAWRPVKSLELSLNGFNLQDPEHFEFKKGKDLVQADPTQVQRSYYGKVTWKF